MKLHNKEMRREYNSAYRMRPSHRETGSYEQPSSKKQQKQ